MHRLCRSQTIVDYQEVSQDYFNWVLNIGVSGPGKGGGKNSGKGGGKVGVKRSAAIGATGAIGARSSAGSSSSPSHAEPVYDPPEDRRLITHIVKHHVCSGSPL